jgi:ubiquinone/menaquinone biosynthesis C-methylase UbiE
MARAEEQLRAEFNDWAKAGRGESMERGHRPVGEQAMSMMGISSESLVLDLGCGGGWATRLMAEVAHDGKAVGVDVSDEMIRVARSLSTDYLNATFEVANAERLPFGDAVFTHAFSMESLYYYADPAAAIREVRRVLKPGGVWCAVIDLFGENEPSHYWVEKLKVPVHVLTKGQYAVLFEEAGFENVECRLLHDPTPMEAGFNSTYFRSREEYVRYREIGSLMVMGQVTK